MIQLDFDIDHIFDEDLYDDIDAAIDNGDDSELMEILNPVINAADDVFLKRNLYVYYAFPEEPHFEVNEDSEVGSMLFGGTLRNDFILTLTCYEMKSLYLNKEKYDVEFHICLDFGGNLWRIGATVNDNTFWGYWQGRGDNIKISTSMLSFAKALMDEYQNIGLKQLMFLLLNNKPINPDFIVK